MSTEIVVSIFQDMMLTALLLAAPMLGVSVLIGLIVAIFQATTQIQEMTLTFVPKIIGIVVVLVVFLPWMINLLIHYSTNLINSIPALVN